MSKETGYKSMNKGTKIHLTLICRMEFAHSSFLDVRKNIYIEQWNRLKHENEDFVQNMNLLHFWYLNYELEVAVNKKWMFLLMERINSEKWKKVLKKEIKKRPPGGSNPRPPG